MKKLFIVVLILPLLINVFNTKDIKNDDLIRIRVLANSNSEYDLNLKKTVSNDLKDTMYSLLKEVEDIDVARTIIKDNMNNIESVVQKDLEKEEYSYKINYGMNYFPEKQYKGKTYEEGEYESLLVTLGKGEGDNWWCILFPPFCLIEAEESNKKVEYSFFLEELFDTIFH